MRESTTSRASLLCRIADALVRGGGKVTKRGAAARVAAAVADGLLRRREKTRNVLALLAAVARQRAARDGRRRPEAPAPGLRGRLAAHKARQFAETVREFRGHVDEAGFRKARAGDHTLRVLPADGRAPSAEGGSSKGERYSGRCTWRRTDSAHTYHIPRGWRRRVGGPGVAVVDGALVLDAEPVPHPGPERVYRVVCATQGPGFSLHTETGHVAVTSDGTAAYAPSAPHALRMARSRVVKALVAGFALAQ